MSNFHLHHQDVDLGIVPLEELRRRRESGELTGAELVWTEGMPAWESLDETLARLAPPTPVDDHALALVGETEGNAVVRYRNLEVRKLG